jgi:NADH-quinone oxidoreductase subunit L
MVQTDIKRVLAYSTVSQLGFMFVALGAGSVTAAMFHLMTHAFFKAMLFLGSGSVILGTHHHQDMDELGGLWRKMPITGTTFLIGSMALAGVIPLAGFWSKDEILHAVDADVGAWAFVLISVAAVFSAFYMTRLFIRTFLGEPRDREVYEHARETPAVMTAPLIILAVFTIVSGFLVFGGVGDALGLPGGFPEYVYTHEGHEFEFDTGLALFSTALAGIGIFGAAYVYRNNKTDRSAALAQWQPGITTMLERKLYFDDLFQFIVDRIVLSTSYLVSWYDRYVVNDTGVNGTAQLTGYAGSVLKYLQTGKVPTYAMAIAVGVITLAIIGVATRV